MLFGSDSDDAIFGDCQIQSETLVNSDVWARSGPEKFWERRPGAVSTATDIRVPPACVAASYPTAAVYARVCVLAVRGSIRSGIHQWHAALYHHCLWTQP